MLAYREEEVGDWSCFEFRWDCGVIELAHAALFGITNILSIS